LLLALCLYPSAQAQSKADLQRAGVLVEQYFQSTSAGKRKRLLGSLVALKLPFAAYEKLVGQPLRRYGRISSGNRQVRFSFLKKRSSGEYSLHVPSGYDPNKPAPLILALHGTDGNGRSYLRWWSRSFGQQYLIAAPSAARQYGLGETSYAYRFTLAVLADVQRIAHVDPDRIYAGGTSMGAHFAYQLGCHLSDRFAAIVPRAGSCHRIVTYKYQANFRNVGIYAVNGSSLRSIKPESYVSVLGASDSEPRQATAVTLYSPSERGFEAGSQTWDTAQGARLTPGWVADVQRGAPMRAAMSAYEAVCPRGICCSACHTRCWKAVPRISSGNVAPRVGSSTRPTTCATSCS